jgi:hypothetical protein
LLRHETDEKAILEFNLYGRKKKSNARNWTLEMNCNGIPNPRWKGNGLTSNSTVWICMLFVVRIKG